MAEMMTGAPSLEDVSVLRDAAKAGRLRIQCNPRREGADTDAGMVWPIEVELPCINGLSCWFTLGNIYSPDRTAQGYTDGVLSDDLARDFAAHIIGSFVAPPSEALAQAIAAARVKNPWQDISTAPRDRDILVFDAKSKRVVMARWNNGIWAGGSLGPYARVTHWMPLPAPPTTPQPDTASPAGGGRT